MANIILIGYMGSGKTTIANLLSKQYGYKCCDTDYLIEKQTKKKISEIFQEQGEEHFRYLETHTLKMIQNQLTNTVLATGGGMPCREVNANLLRKLGLVVYLKVSKETVINRLKNDTTRPLLQTEDMGKKVEEMLAVRGPLYEKAAHVVLEVDLLNADQVVTKIVELVKQYQGNKLCGGDDESNDCSQSCN